MINDNRLNFPATQRNAGPIIEVLRDVLPTKGFVIEVASGSGQHVARFASEFPDLTWQPTDMNPECCRSIAAWTEGVKNILAPLELDTTSSIWPVERADSILCINMIHIAPWSAGLGLLSGAGRILSRQGIFFLYGPYKIGGVHTAESNARFDESLSRQDSSWGLRDLNDVVKAAEDYGLVFERTVEMPANNLSVIFRKLV